MVWSIFRLPRFATENCTVSFGWQTTERRFASLSSTAIPTNYALAWYLMLACCAAIRELTIPGTALAVGGNYFSTVLTINVTDPVDGTVLTNTTAEYKYSYAGRTWFFASEANYNRFRNAPEAFVPGTVQEE
jgi:YHS domain-containing protein